MLKQGQFLKQLQKLSPQQIQLMKLLQLPTTALEQRIKEELETNPALEEGLDEEEPVDSEEEIDRNDDEKEEDGFEDEKEPEKIDDELELDDFMDDVEAAEYKYEINNSGKDVENREVPVVSGPEIGRAHV